MHNASFLATAILAITVPASRRVEIGPSCSVRFEIQEDAQKRISDLLGVNCAPPSTVVLTRYYDGSLDFEYEPQIRENPITADLILAALDEFASGARRLDMSQR